jgi:hypothetical protein
LAILNEEILALKAKIECQQPTGRKAVQKEASNAFYNLEAIDQARSIAKRQGQR